MRAGICDSKDFVAQANYTYWLAGYFNAGGLAIHK
jgi:hypothetical protein